MKIKIAIAAAVFGFATAQSAFAQDASSCLTGSDSVEVCGFDCKMGSDGTAACAATAEGECKINSDGSVVCGYNCAQGNDGKFACGKAVGEKCMTAETGVVRCMPPTVVESAPAVTPTPVTPEPTPTATPTTPAETVDATPTAEPKPAAMTTAMEKDTDDDKGPSVWFKSEIISQDNADFSELVDETFFERTFTDDRFTSARTKLFVSGEIEPESNLEFNYNVGVDATLGRFVSTNAGSFDISVRELAATWEAFESDTFGLELSAGVMPLSIGGASDDYFFNSSVTGLSLAVDTPGGEVSLYGLIDSFGYDSPSYSSVFAGERSGSFTSSNFGGDLSTFILGGVYRNEDLVENLGIYGFGFYADIGAGPAPHTGSDRTLGGTQGNFDDADFNWMAGLRLRYDLNAGMFNLGIMGEFARSGGVDRKNIVTGFRDIESNGNAFGAALEPKLSTNAVDVRGSLRFFRSDGAQHTGAEGLPFNYGFVGFRGSRLGGKALGSSSGWRPTAFIGSHGFDFNPSDRVRSGGTQFFKIGAGATILERVSLDLALWILQDTSATNFEDFDNVAAISDELPFGYTESDVLAQERFGKSLGTEIDIDARIHAVKDRFDIYAGYALVIPSDFQSIPIRLNAGDVLGQEDPPNFWLVSGGVELKF